MSKPANWFKGNGRGDVAKQELEGVEQELRAAEQALAQLQRRLETLREWRASLAWEAVDAAQDALGRGMFDAWELPRMPKDFRYWWEKYSDDAGPL